MLKKYRIDALPIHKDICCYLIDNRITFTCYNRGLLEIHFEMPQMNKGDEFISKLIEIFNLNLENQDGNEYLYKN